MGDLSCDDYFYPRSPCGERHRPVTMHTWRKAFLSTLSLRRATISIALLTPPTKFLSTLSLRRATGGLKVIVFSITHFYPRSPCGERRFVGVAQGAATGFLSTLSLRRATRFLASLSAVVTISIHALLAESDGKSHKHAGLKLVFLSTLSLRRATGIRHIN